MTTVTEYNPALPTMTRPAAHPVKCESGGIHHPRTLDMINSHGQHIKVSVCRKCELMA